MLSPRLSDNYYRALRDAISEERQCDRSTIMARYREYRRDATLHEAIDCINQAYDMLYMSEFITFLTVFAHLLKTSSTGDLYDYKLGDRHDER